MGAVQEIGNGQGDLERWPPYGLLGLGKTVRITAPVNGQAGFAPGCEWVQYFASGYAIRYINQGSATSSFWVESDAGPGSLIAFGQSGAALPTTAAMIAPSGNVYRNILSAAGVNPTATAGDYIVDAFWVPAGSFDVAGRGLSVTAYGTAAANANQKFLKVYLGATNAAFPALPAIGGTVAVAGGTLIGSTGALTTNSGGIILTCQIFKRGAAGSNTQESMTTGIVSGGTHAGCGSWTDQTFTESSNLLLVVTARVVTATTDLAYNGCEITAFN